MRFHFSLLIASCLLVLSACIDPVEPEFDYIDGVIFIDANAATEAGKSYVKIERSVIDRGLYRTELVPNAAVFVENIEDGRQVSFLENKAVEAYLPDEAFSVRTGEKWRLRVELEDGRRYESEVEEVTGGVAVEEIFANYSPEATFLQGQQAFVPGHKVSIRFNDPVDEPNYYLWRYKTFESLQICQSCVRGRFRNGECEDNTVRFRDFDYLCEVPCWFVREGEAFQLFDDQLVDGRSGIEQEVAVLAFRNQGNILIELEQVALSPSGYAFYQIINDVLNESSGLNAPPPAALLGNLYNPEDRSEAVLGQFNAVDLTTYSLFIDRSGIQESALNPTVFPGLEDPNDPTSVFTAPCEESETRTAVRPKGWL